MSKRTRKMLEVLGRFSETVSGILFAPSRHELTSAAYVRGKLRAIDEEIRNVKRRWAGYAFRETRDEFAEGVRKARKFFARSELIGSTFQKPTVRMLENQIIADMFEGLDNGRKQSLRFLRGTQQKAISDAKISQALVEGVATPKSAQLKVLEQIARSGNVIRINGRNYDPKSYAEMVARTRIREAQSLATVQTVVNHGRDLVRISDHGDTDPLCAQYAGRVFSVSGESKEFDQLTEFPPFHPNCRHVMTPFILAPEDTQIGKDQRQELAKADRESGKVKSAIKRAGGGQEGLRKLQNKHTREERAEQDSIIKKTDKGFVIIKDGQKRSGTIRSERNARRRASNILFRDKREESGRVGQGSSN